MSSRKLNDARPILRRLGTCYVNLLKNLQELINIHPVIYFFKQPDFFSNMGNACISYFTLGLFIAVASFANSKAAFEEEITYVITPSRDFENFYLEVNSLMGKLNVD